MKYLTKRIICAASCLLILTSAAFALYPSDYGPEAENDFETKRDAYSGGFEWGVEYSSDPSNSDSAYNQGYEEGYRAGLSADPSAPDNDIIDRSEVAGTSSYPQKTEKKSWIYSDNVGLLVFPLVGVIALFLWLLDKLIQKRR